MAGTNTTVNLYIYITRCRNRCRNDATTEMTSTQTSKVNNDDEMLKKLLRDRIAQLESREEDPPRSADEQAAEDAFQVACTAARALVADKDIAAEEKLRVLQLMFTDCVSNVRALEYDLGLEEKRLSVAELDYSELGEDLRKIDSSTDKLKAQSRELSKQNKAMLEESERRTGEERGKREEIVEKFDEAMRDINAKLNTDEYVDEEKDELACKLEADFETLQSQYDEREKYYEKAINTATLEERKQTELLRQAEEQYERDEMMLVTERRKLSDLKKQVTYVSSEINKISDRRDKVKEREKEREELLKRQQVDMNRLDQTERNVRKAKMKISEEAEELKSKMKDTNAKVKVCEEELEFWKPKSKSALEKRETLERLCRTLTEERTIMRKEVQAMQAAWGMLENEIENLRMEINEPDKSNS